MTATVMTHKNNTYKLRNKEKKMRTYVFGKDKQETLQRNQTKQYTRHEV
jgi:hypothetical protein